MAGGGHFKKIKNTEGIESILNPTIAGGKSMIKGAVIGLALALSAKLIYAVVRFLIGQ
ncbi:MAG: hypothetical protein NTZ42_02445 [Candidatus Gribaldobacteria bacterium]|nr:hypothetical protein [Candidatus Gribaldobacteria bacterium]